jgi:hypothetical protein
LVTFTAATAWAADPVVIEPYTRDEFPAWAHDLRRTEIITLGSLPFVTLTVTMGYSFYNYAFAGGDAPNVFDRDADAFSEDDQKMIIGISIVVSALLGIIDLALTANRRAKAARTYSGGVTVIAEPLADTAPATLETAPEAD